jgi:hypothetical protein
MPVQRVNERVSPDYLELEPPRPFPSDALPDLAIDHLVRPALRQLLNPLTGIAMVVLVLVVIFQPRWYLLLPIILLIGVRAWPGTLRVIQQMSDEISLLRYGLIVRAHVLRIRPHRTILGEIDGAHLDCAIAVAPRRTYIGSVWLSDGAEAVQIARNGRVLVLCLPRTPGSWRVVEALQSDIQYDRMGPMQPIPTDI